MRSSHRPQPLASRPFEYALGFPPQTIPTLPVTWKCFTLHLLLFALDACIRNDLAGRKSSRIGWVQPTSPGFPPRAWPLDRMPAFSSFQGLFLLPSYPILEYTALRILLCWSDCIHDQEVSRYHEKFKSRGVGRSREIKPGALSIYLSTSEISPRPFMMSLITCGESWGWMSLSNSNIYFYIVQ